MDRARPEPALPHLQERGRVGSSGGAARCRLVGRGDEQPALHAPQGPGAVGGAGGGARDPGGPRRLELLPRADLQAVLWAALPVQHRALLPARGQASAGLCGGNQSADWGAVAAAVAVVDREGRGTVALRMGRWGEHPLPACLARSSTHQRPPEIACGGRAHAYQWTLGPPFFPPHPATEPTKLTARCRWGCPRLARPGGVGRGLWCPWHTPPPARRGPGARRRLRARGAPPPATAHAPGETGSTPPPARGCPAAAHPGSPRPGWRGGPGGGKWSEERRNAVGRQSAVLGPGQKGDTSRALTHARWSQDPKGGTHHTKALDSPRPSPPPPSPSHRVPRRAHGLPRHGVLPAAQRAQAGRAEATAVLSPRPLSLPAPGGGSQAPLQAAQARTELRRGRQPGPEEASARDLRRGAHLLPRAGPGRRRRLN